MTCAYYSEGLIMYDKNGQEIGLPKSFARPVFCMSVHMYAFRNLITIPYYHFLHIQSYVSTQINICTSKGTKPFLLTRSRQAGGLRTGNSELRGGDLVRGDFVLVDREVQTVVTDWIAVIAPRL